MENGKDTSLVESTPLPILLYADDTVLLARTQIALQDLIERYTSFMADLDL